MKILIIKLGALGDVLRTIPIAEALKKKYPNSEITWITKKNALELFEGNKNIDYYFALPYESDKKFDLLYNFDIEKEATELASKVDADKKYGFSSEGDYPSAFNLGAEYYLNTLFDDEIKKTNMKTYQEMMFGAAELVYNKEMPQIYLSNKEIDYAEEFIKNNHLGKKEIIGIHMGAGPRWPSKAWSEERIKEFIKKAKDEGYDLVLFAGPEEKDKIKKLSSDLDKIGLSVSTNNPLNTVKEFSALVSKCNHIVCSDSFSLHISLAMKKPTIGLFFCTTPHEVEGYGLLKKIVSPLFDNFFPQKQDQFDEGLINSISSTEVLDAISNKNK